MEQLTRTVELGDMCSFTQGVQIAERETIKRPRDGYVRYLYIRDFFSDKKQVFVRDEYPQKALTPLDIVMVNTGNTSGSVYRGKVGILCNNAFKITIRPDKSDELDSEYLWCYLCSDARERMLKRLFNPAGQPHVGHKNVARLKIPLPAKSEQKKIAQILSTWDKAITTTEQLLANSQQQKKALMQQLLTGKRRLPGYSSKFQRLKFSDLLDIDRRNLGRSTAADYEFRYISLSDVSKGRIAYELKTHKYGTAPSRARRLVNKGDILMATVRPNLKGFCKVDAAHDGCIASTGFSALTPRKTVCGDYIYHYLFGAHVAGQINALVVGTNYPAINSSDVANLHIYCPDFDEQQEIASVLNACDEQIRLLANNLRHLALEKKGLMQQLLTGKLRVKKGLSND